MSPGRGQLEADTELVFAWLMEHGPCEVANKQELAVLIGIPRGRLGSVLHHVRSPEWIEEHAWWIPYVAKGVKPKVFVVDDTADMRVVNQQGLQVHVRETLTRARREQAQLETHYARLPDKRTHVARGYRDAITLQAGAIVGFEALYSLVGGGE